MNYHRSAGPAVWKDDDGAYRGACSKKCSGALIVCGELMGRACHVNQNNPRPIDDPAETPDWCPYLASMIRDAEQDERFRELGLDPYKKQDVLKVIRAMPREHRPKYARKLQLGPLHKAIHQARKTGWEITA